MNALSKLHLFRILAFHSLLFAGFWVGASPIAIGTFALVYYLMAFSVSAFNHRYFSHRTFRTSRAFQLVMAWICTMSGQKGPLSWATSHRRHHRHTEKAGDPHSPYPAGFWYAHLGWLLEKNTLPTDPREVADWWQFPELRWLNRFHFVGPLSLAALLAATGIFIQSRHPEMGTGVLQMLYWGFVCPTLLNVHATCLTNSWGHGFWRGIGLRSFDLQDSSSNLWWLFPLSPGDNWHNNHHRYPASASAGVAPWELDLIYAGIKGLEKLGLVWEVRHWRTKSLAATPSPLRSSEATLPSASTSPSKLAWPDTNRVEADF